MDFNNDGFLDIIVGDRNGFVNYFRGTAVGVLTTEPDIKANGTTIDVGNSSAPVIVDWNEDGLLDLIVGRESTSGGSVRLYINSGTTSNHVFTTYSVIQSGSSSIAWYRCCPQVVDLNLDGKKDLIIGENNARLVYYENTGTNASPQFSGYEYLKSNGSIIDLYYGSRFWVNDWNEDGTLDLIVSDYNGWIYLYLGWPTGIAEEENAAFNSQCDLTVSRSPTNGLFSVDLLLGTECNVDFRIYSVDGRIVSETSAGQLTSGEHTFIFDLSAEPSGLYFVQADTGVMLLSETVVLLP